MKISNKITLLVIFLLMAMGANTFIGLTQLKKVGNEFRRVAQGYIALTEIVTSIAHDQLEKAVLFERLQRVAEEIAFENVNASRKIHLFDHIGITKRGFDHLSGKVAKEIIEGRKLIDELLKQELSQIKNDEIQNIKSHLANIETAHINYDKSVNRMIELVKSEKLEISLEDISNLRREDARLSKGIQALLSMVQHFTRNSLQTAARAENVAQKILWNSLMFSIFIGSVVAVYLIKSISRPLKKLVKAAIEIGKGDLAVKVDSSDNLEINELSHAFNTMTTQLADAKIQLEEKNKALSENLDLVEEQKKDLEKVNKELDNFVGTVSHDIRSPLMGISGYSTILQKQYADQLDKRAQRCIHGINKGVHRVNDMIVDLLQLTKISRVRNPYEEVNMDNLIDSIIDRLEYRINEHRVAINIADNMPTIVCDRIKMGEVFHNLISNAVKFSSKQDYPPILDIGYRDDDEVYEFHVKDNGIGIAEEDQERVFGFFKRLETAKDFEGTGAGLSIVKQIIDEHGGRIWIDSKVGEYTCFYFTVAKNLKNENAAA